MLFEIDDEDYATEDDEFEYTDDMLLDDEIELLIVEDVLPSLRRSMTNYD